MIYVIGWFLVGWIPLVLFIYKDYIQGFDITLQKIINSLLFGVLGPIVLVVWLAFFLIEEDDIVIIKGKKQNND